MSKLAKALTAAAGNAGESLYVEDVFSTYLYEGNGTSQTITNGIDLSGEGGMVWTKDRTGTFNHSVRDSVRGGQYRLITSLTNSQADDTTTGITSFNSDGYTHGSQVSGNYLGRDYASWTFRKAEKFFDVVTFSTSGAGGTQSVNHNLGVPPAFIIIKKTSAAQTWIVYHSSVTSPNSDWWKNFTALDGNAQFFDWGDNSGIASAPTDTSVTLGSYFTNPTADYVMYLFASDAGGFGDDGSENIIKCGSYTGNGGTQEINLGFEPQWLLIKSSTQTDSWFLTDTMRGMPNNSPTPYLLPNLSNAEAEASAGYFPQATATGFKIGASGSVNGSGQTFIYIAIRRPMKTPESGTEVYNAIARTGTGTTEKVTGVGFPPDVMQASSRNVSSNNPLINDRLRGAASLVFSNTTGAEYTASGIVTSFDMDGISVGTTAAGAINVSGQQNIYHFFKRATGFMDVVAYTSTTSAINHNLGVSPELVIYKSRTAGGWLTMVATDGFGELNSSGAWGGAGNGSGLGPNLANATATTITGAGNLYGSGVSMVTYLFATLAGVSKVGSYTGTAATLNVDCGFSAGARFILIKRTDSTGDWYVYDSVRGIVAGNDPYLLLNSTAAEVTTTDYIDPLSSGFTVTSSAPAALNASGGNYIFLAIA